jgi:hypothetical protein
MEDVMNSSIRFVDKFRIVLSIVTIAPLWLMLAAANTSAYAQTTSSPADWTQFLGDNMQRWNPYETVLGVNNVVSREVSAISPQQAVEAYGRLPLSFEANQGQADSQVKFLSHGSGYSLFLTGSESVLVLKKQAEKASPHSRIEHASLAAHKAATKSEAVLGMRLVGASAAAQVTGLEELPGKSNYFIGHDFTKWRTGIPNYAKVKYANVYPGIDLVYYGNQRQLEFDLVVHPGGDPKAVKLDFRTAVTGKQATLRVNNSGDLVVGEVIFHKPVVYQPTSNDKTRATDKELIDGRFVLTGAHEVCFQIAAYDRTRPLVIDPTLAYSTYLGGSGQDVAGGIAVDASGNAYVTGNTGSTNFPTTPGTLQTTYGGLDTDAFVSKLNAAGSALLYSTYLGGSANEGGGGIAVDASGNAYVTGGTGSPNFPITPGAFQTTFGGTFDAFVSKLNASGSTLLYSTYLGGSDGDGGSGIKIDALGNAYVTGLTDSSNFPVTRSAFQTAFGGNSDAFVSKLNAAGSALLYSTYLGGSGDENSGLGSGGIAVDASGNAYVTGDTNSSNFPTTPGAVQTNLGGGGSRDAFVSKLNAAGSALLYSTYLGGSGDEAGNDIAVDVSGNAYVTGHTQSTNFPTTTGAFQTALHGPTDAFVSKLNAAGSALLYSTYLGGSANGYAEGYGIAVDASGNAYVTGGTFSNFPITSDAFQTTPRGAEDAFLSKLNAAGSALLYSTYLGGSDGDLGGGGIAVDSSGNAYIAGFTASSNFPITPGAFQTTSRGGGDIFVSKFSFTLGSADLFLRIRPSATTVHQGDLLTFAFPVWNLGPDVAEGEVLSNLQVPAGTTFDYLRISGTPGLGTCTHPPYGGTGQIICHEGDGMAPNTTWTVRLTVKVTAPAGTVITESAATLADTPDPNLANNTATVSVNVE